MIFSSSEIEKAGKTAYYAGMPKNKNPYLHKNGFINKLKLKMWNYGFELAEREGGV